MRKPPEFHHQGCEPFKLATILCVAMIRALGNYYSKREVRILAEESHVIRTYGDTDFITGLRAIAATMVVIIHTGMLSDYGTVGQAITLAGKYGVDIFFVISGFTIAKTFQEARNYRSYLIRRIMRILPLYWLIISMAMALWMSGLFSLPQYMQELGSNPDFYNYFMHLSMISYLDYRVANSVLGVEWTIPIEVFWYICLPPLIYFGKTIPRTLVIIVVLVIMTALLTFASKNLFGTSLPIKWSPIAHGHLFFIGVSSFYLRQRFKEAQPPQTVTWIAGAVFLFVFAIFVKFDGRSEILALSTAILIVYVTPDRAPWVTKPLTNGPMLFLGSVSYSIYLIHNLIIHILGDTGMLPSYGVKTFIVVYGITILLSTVTYLLVEKPTNSAGRRIVDRYLQP